MNKILLFTDRDNRTPYNFPQLCKQQRTTKLLISHHPLKSPLIYTKQSAGEWLSTLSIFRRRCENLCTCPSEHQILLVWHGNCRGDDSRPLERPRSAKTQENEEKYLLDSKPFDQKHKIEGQWYIEPNNTNKLNTHTHTNKLTETKASTHPPALVEEHVGGAGDCALGLRAGYTRVVEVVPVCAWIW